MKHEFKVTKSKEQTVYTLEAATGGSTSVGGGAIANVDTALGGMQRRPKDSIFAQEEKTETPKPRNFVAKNAKMGGAGKMKDKSKTIPRHEKHKKPVAEGLHPMVAADLEKLKTLNPVDRFSAYSNIRDYFKGDPELSKMASDLMGGYYEADMLRGKYKTDAAKAKYAELEPIHQEFITQALSQGQGVAEEWSQKYKSSINCSHPKGFSQKAHCAGKNKHDESIEMEAVCPDCGMCETHGNVMEIKKGQKDANGFTRCWPGKHAVGTKKGKNGGQVRNCKPNEGVAEGFNGEYDDEAGMAHSNLITSARAVIGLLKTIDNRDNLPEWAQEKIAKAEMMLVAVWDYLQSQKAQGIDPKVAEGLGKMRGNPGAYDADVRASQSGMNRPHNHRDPEGEDDPRETMMWNLTVNGKPLNPRPIMGRSNLIKFGKQQAAAGVDLSNAMISPVKEMEEDAYMMELASKVAEKLNPNDPTDVWVQDFQKADPNKYHQFKKKTPQKKAQMAVAAHYAANEPSKKN